MTKSKTVELLEFYLPGYVVVFERNMNKVSLLRNLKKLVIDPKYMQCNFVVLLYMCYATTIMRECDNDVCLADRKAIEHLKAEGHTVNKQFYLDVLQILSDRNPARLQVLNEKAYEHG